MRRTALAVLVISALGSVGCDGGPVSLSEIQGPRLRSSFEGRVVDTHGIVTALRADGSGFWLQDAEGDGRPETSDAVQVASDLAPAIGDDVRVRATVVERTYENGLPLTRLEELDLLEILSSGNPLPEPVSLEPLPALSIPDAILYWRRLESMRVAVDAARVIAPTSRFGETPIVVESQRPEGRHLFVRPTRDGGVDYNPERILLDDAVTEPLGARAGDRVDDVVAVVDYSFGAYKLQPSSQRHTEGDRLVPEPRSSRGFSVATFNVENLFDGPDDELRPKLAKLSRFIHRSLRLPAILTVQEVENEAVLAKLATRLEDETGAPYRARALGSSDGRGIENGLLYDSSQVSLVEARLMSGPAIDAAFGPRSTSPGREPLVGRFRIDGSTSDLYVIGNHLKSKRGDDPLFGARQPPRRSTETSRKQQARALRAGVDAILEGSPGALVLLAGDFNDFAFAEPGEGPDHPLGVLEGLDGAAKFENLILRLDDPYTFLFEGNAQVLDHVLVSPALSSRVVGLEIVHGNADFPGAASDHDVPVVRIQLP